MDRQPALGMRHARAAWFRGALLVGLVCCCLLAAWAQAPAPTGQVLLLQIDGAIGPASADYLRRGLEHAQEINARLVVLQMDTPGGLDSSMRDMIRDILASAVPVATYVAPSGARAASAGTYILYASHIAAMAPATNLGAATPVQIGGLPSPGGGGNDEQPRGEKPKDEKPAAGGDAMEKKLVNDAVAYIRGLALLRGRNADWAEQAVREAASLTAADALKQGVIDVVASDVATLLRSIDGRKVVVAGVEQTLETAGLTVERLLPDWRVEFLATITNPSVAYILLLVGIYGLFFELANPGFVAPGVVGAICLLLAAYAFQLLPVNYAGLGLMLLGIAFMLAEAFVPSFGALGIGGVIAFVAGSVMLLDTDVPGYEIAWPLIAAVALTSAAFFMGVVGLAVRARHRPVVSGREQMVGSVGEAMGDFQGRGWVRVHGEQWQAVSATALRRGDRVRVVAMDGLQLRVEPILEPRD